MAKIRTTSNHMLHVIRRMHTKLTRERKKVVNVVKRWNLLQKQSKCELIEMSDVWMELNECEMSQLKKKFRFADTNFSLSLSFCFTRVIYRALLFFMFFSVYLNLSISLKLFVFQFCSAYVCWWQRGGGGGVASSSCSFLLLFEYNR